MPGRATATTASVPPMSIVLLPALFSPLSAASAAAALARLAGVLPLAAPLAPAATIPAFLPPLAGVSFSAVSSAGSSTTKRYLHLGQSILRPIRPLSRIGTLVSQLGHCWLTGG